MYILFIVLWLVFLSNKTYTKKMAVSHLGLKSEILEKIKNNGGWTNAHAHLDRAYSVTSDTLKYLSASLQEKWNLNDDLKRNSSIQDVHDRMRMGVERMLEQGVTTIGTFIDVDDRIEDKAIKAAQKIREEYKKDVDIVYINQVHYGVIDTVARRWFDVAADFVDIIGGLPEKDKGHEAEHIDILLNTAKSKKKMVHVHVDQYNSPNQNDTELLVDKVIEHDMQGKVVGVHGLSLAAQKKEVRERIYKKMKKAEFMMVACPYAWIDSGRNEVESPTHNALTPIDELISAGITVALGTDNINDIYKPYSNGDMWEEFHLMFEGNKFYDIDELVKVATVNGRKTLGL
jgi:cytosine/creatinine deaminase